MTEEPTDKSKVVIYTAITGGYETLRNPDYIDPEITYICFTDQPFWLKFSNTTIWKIRKIPTSTLDLTRKARHVKTQPHIYLDKIACDYSIWIDGNVNVVGDISKLIQSLGDFSFAGFKHYMRDCLYDEALACLDQQNDDPAVITSQTKRYQLEGFPSHYGLLETNVLIRKHNRPEINRLMDCWWNEIRERSRRDQLSLTYACWKLGITPTLMGDDNTRGNSAYFETRPGWRTQSNKNKLAVLYDKYIRWRLP